MLDSPRLLLLLSTGGWVGGNILRHFYFTKGTFLSEHSFMVKSWGVGGGLWDYTVISCDWVYSLFPFPVPFLSRLTIISTLPACYNGIIIVPTIITDWSEVSSRIVPKDVSWAYLVSSNKFKMILHLGSCVKLAQRISDIIITTDTNVCRYKLKSEICE